MRLIFIKWSMMIVCCTHMNLKDIMASIGYVDKLKRDELICTVHFLLTNMMLNSKDPYTSNTLFRIKDRFTDMIRRI